MQFFYSEASRKIGRRSAPRCPRGRSNSAARGFNSCLRGKAARSVAHETLVRDSRCDGVDEEHRRPFVAAAPNSTRRELKNTFETASRSRNRDQNGPRFDGR